MDRRPPPADAASLAERAAQLASASAVGASMAHELRNALAVAESSLFLARRDMKDPEKLVRHLDKVAAEIRRSQASIFAILALARGERVAKDRVPIARVVDSARGCVVMPDHLRFTVAIEPGDLSVPCNALLLEHVLSNLYLNAIDALAPRGAGAITTHAARTGDRVSLVVEDDGPGIEAPVAETLFDPLVTTKATGTGLGLALCRTILASHDATIAAGPAPSGGARFVITLPA